MGRFTALLLAVLNASLAVSQPRPVFLNDLSTVGMQMPDVLRRSTNLGPAALDQPIHLCVALNLRDPDGLKAYADAVSSPKSPLYRRFLEPGQIASLYALPYSDVQNVADYFRSHGFTVSRIGRTNTSIILDGTVAQANAAFNTKIARYRINNPNEWGNAEYISYSDPIEVPSAIAPDILHVEGLETFTKPKPLATLTPAQTQTLYNLAPIAQAAKGAGRKIGISNWDGYRLSNVPLYYAQFGLSAPAGGVGSNIHEVHVGSGPFAGAGTPGGEGDLDIQMALGMAPHAELTIYDGIVTGNRLEVVTRQADDNAMDIITESYGWWYTAMSAYEANHNQHLIMTVEGITYLAASGDYGTDINRFPYPGMDGEALMVGGTIATLNGSNQRLSEVGWSGSGGGWSTVNAPFNVRPAWQVGTGVPTAIDRRLIPDVSLHAHGGTGGAFPFFYNGSLNSDFWGTSFSAPIFAGSLAVTSEKLIALGGLPADGFGNRRFGRLQDVIYAQNGRPDVWYDVTSGGNGNLPNGSASVATVGWDTVTGWGCVDFNALLNILKPAQISGWVKQNGVGLSGVAVEIRQGPEVRYTAITDAQGNYTVGVANGTYTIVPLHNDKYFFPSGRLVDIEGVSATGQNFTGANNGPVSIQFEYPVVYSDQSRRCTLNLIVATPVARDIAMSDNTTKLTSPIKVTIPAGQRSANFFVYGVTVTSDVVATLTASHQGVVATGSITVRAKPALTGISLANTVRGGQSISGSASINKPAVGAMYLVLGTNNPGVAVTIPSATAMPHGATTKTFTCRTFPVGAATNVTVSASFYGSTATKVVQVTP